MFTGLGAIPYDTLGCQLLFIGRSRFDLTNSVAYVYKNESSVSISSRNGEYKEFHIVPELFEQVCTKFEICFRCGIKFVHTILFILFLLI